MTEISQAEFDRGLRRTEFYPERLYWNTHGHQNSDDDLYFISNGVDSIKIGRSKNVKKRLSHLQIGSAQKLDIFFVAKNKGFMECHLHKFFSDFKIKGEWFLLNERIPYLVYHMRMNPFPEKPYLDNNEFYPTSEANLPTGDFGDTFMPFGRYKGVKLKMIPIDYMVWCVNNCRRKDIIPYFLMKIAEHNDL